MHAYVVFCHPSRNSFTFAVLESFLAGLREAGHTAEVGDLYAMEFRSDMGPAQYERETSLRPALPVPPDVAAEQGKIRSADVLVFIYPVWWSDCPARLKGWFDRVWSLGYAYTYEDGVHVTPGVGVNRALALCPAGHTEEHLEATGIAGSMRRIMLDDRLRGVGIEDAEMVILGGMVPPDPGVREANLRRAFELARHLGRRAHEPEP